MLSNAAQQATRRTSGERTTLAEREMSRVSYDIEPHMQGLELQKLISRYLFERVDDMVGSDENVSSWQAKEDEIVAEARE